LLLGTFFPASASGQNIFYMTFGYFSFVTGLN